MRTPSIAPSVRTRRTGRRGEWVPVRVADEVRGTMLSASRSGDADAIALWLPLVERRARSAILPIGLRWRSTRSRFAKAPMICSLQSRQLFIIRLLRGDGLCEVWRKTPCVVCRMSFSWAHLFLAPRLTNGSSALGHLKAAALFETRRGSRSDSCGLFGVLVAATLGMFVRFFGFLSTACILRLPSLRAGSLLGSRPPAAVGNACFAAMSGETVRAKV